MAAKYLAGVVIMLMVLALGCKKDEPIVEQYEPITLAGKWNVYAWYSNQPSGVQNYPNIIDSTIITFSDTGRILAVSSCAPGSGFYLQTQTGEIVVSNFVNSQQFCGALENDTQDKVYEALRFVYSYKIENNELTLRSRLANIPFLYLRRLP